MPTYEYLNAAGRRFEIFAAMSKMPPEEIIVFPDGKWQAAADRIEGMYDDPETGEINQLRAAFVHAQPKAERIFTRQITGGGGIIVTDLVPKANGKGLTVSRAAPRRKGGKLRKVGDHVVREHDDGVFTNKQGQPIIENNAQARRVAKSTGMDID